jgi:hypothetical protein
LNPQSIADAGFWLTVENKNWAPSGNCPNYLTELSGSVHIAPPERELAADRARQRLRALLPMEPFSAGERVKG